MIVKFLRGSTFRGNIQTGTSANGNDYSSNIVTFENPGATNNSQVVSTGDIISYGTGTFYLDGSKDAVSRDNGNHVTFKDASMTGNIRAVSVSHDSSAKYVRFGFNKVIFSSADAQTLTGNVTASGGENHRILQCGDKEDSRQHHS